MSATDSFDIRKVDRDHAACSPSSQRSSSYSPPAAVPTMPKAMYTALKYELLRQTPSWLNDPFEASYIGAPSSTHLSSPMLAPWNEHRMRPQDKQFQQVRSSTEGSHHHSIDLQPVASVQKCDNYGCNGSHNHYDCPLEKRCWGCRSLNHFWTDCPMTCKDCGSARHVPKHCSEFSAPDSYGIAYPRRPSMQETRTGQAHLPVEKVYTCDNYGCRDMHSHYDCPLPSICWGCRSTEHFWSSCHERCDKCGAKRHTAKYCHEFELWRDGLSRPKRPPQDIITKAMKRQREQEINREQGIELSSPPAKRKANQANDSSPPSESTMTKPESNTLIQNSDDSSSTEDTLIDNRVRDREFCTFWLRMGRCSYEFTPLGCKYKHEIPDPKTLQAMGIQFAPDWLNEKEKAPPTSWVYKAPAAINAPLPEGQLPLAKPGSPYTGRESGSRQRESSTLSGTAHGEINQLLPDQQVTRASIPASLTPASPPTNRQSSSSEVQPPMSDRMKAFEEEEYFKQKRHEAEMKRKADEQKLEYEHELRMAKLRKR